MQRVNFLAKEYRLEPVRNEEMIGICDPEGERPAYSTSDKNSPDKWVATIKNTGNENIQFIPVDKNIVYYRDDGQKESSCDGMILYNDDSSICFVELKDVRTSGWISDAIDQLKETIKVFNKITTITIFPTELLMRPIAVTQTFKPPVASGCRNSEAKPIFVLPLRQLLK